MEKQTVNDDPEIIAIGEVYAALKDLDAEARTRVLNYVSAKFSIPRPANHGDESDMPPPPPSREKVDAGDDELEGISPAGKKWIARSGIQASNLMKIFSLGIDEIDLVARSVPGKSKSERMRNVFLLKGIGAYLGTGLAKFSHDQIKEACLHYDAFDSPNFATRLKAMSAEVSGGRETGYTLTAKGISEGTLVIKAMLGGVKTPD